MRVLWSLVATAAGLALGLPGSAGATTPSVTPRVTCVNRDLPAGTFRSSCPAPIRMPSPSARRRARACGSSRARGERRRGLADLHGAPAADRRVVVRRLVAAGGCPAAPAPGGVATAGFAYRWCRADTGPTPIAGATSPSYTPTDDDLGHTLGIVVRALSDAADPATGDAT